MINALSVNNWVTITIVLLIGILVLLNYFFEIRFEKFISLVQIDEYFVDYVNKSSMLFNSFNLFLFLFQAGVYSLLLLKVNEIFLKTTTQNQFLLYLKIYLILIIFYLFRYIIGRVIALLVEMEKEQALLTFIKISAVSKIAILLFPAIIILYYLPFSNVILSKIIVLIMVVSLLFKYLQILQKNQKLIFGNLFYFILYLCALEITPLVYLFKLLINKA